MPRLDETYRAGDLPPGSVVRTVGRSGGPAWGPEYVVGRRGHLMRWEQPIPGSENRQVAYVGRLAPGQWMTPRERAEVDVFVGRDRTDELEVQHA